MTEYEPLQIDMPAGMTEADFIRTVQAQVDDFIQAIWKRLNEETPEQPTESPHEF